MTTAPNAAPKNIAAIDSSLLANLGLLPFASEESAPMPVIVSVRTVVVRSGLRASGQQFLSDGKLELSVPVGRVPLAISLARLWIVLPSAQPSRPAIQRGQEASKPDCYETLGAKRTVWLCNTWAHNRR